MTLRYNLSAFLCSFESDFTFSWTIRKNSAMKAFLASWLLLLFWIFWWGKQKEACNFRLLALTPPSCSFPSLVCVMLNWNSLPNSFSSVQGFVPKGNFRWAGLEFAGPEYCFPSRLPRSPKVYPQVEISRTPFIFNCYSQLAGCTFQRVPVVSFGVFLISRSSNLLLIPTAASYMNGSSSWVFTSQ